MLPDAALANMLDTYAIVQAQRALTIDDDEVRHVRRAAEEAPGHPAQESAAAPDARAGALQNGGAESARPGRRDAPSATSSTALREHDDRAAVELRQAYDALDEVLDTRQQARFRMFEEQIERRKLDLLVRARARSAAKTATGVTRLRHRGGPARPSPLARPAQVCVQLPYDFAAAVSGSRRPQSGGTGPPRRPATRHQAGRGPLPGQARSHHELCQSRPRRGRDERERCARVADHAADRRRSEFLSALPPQGPGAGRHRRSDLERARRRTRRRARRPSTSMRCASRSSAGGPIR